MIPFGPFYFCKSTFLIDPYSNVIILVYLYPNQFRFLFISKFIQNNFNSLFAEPLFLEIICNE